MNRAWYSEPIGDLACALCAVALCLSARVQAQAVPQIAPPPVPVPPPASAPAPAPGSAAAAPVVSPPAALVPPAPTGPALTLHDAVQSTLRLHPAIALSRTAIAARSADVLAASAPFDPLLHSSLGQSHDSQFLLPSERFAPSERDLATDRTSWSLGASAGFPWGMSVAPTVTFERVKSRRDPNPSGFTIDPVQRAHADLRVLQPLLRGAGTVGAASELHAAQRAHDAAEYSSAYTAQSQVYATIIAYYRFVAATNDLAGFRDSVARAQRLLDETQQLVDAEHRPRADLRQVQASLENQTSGLLATEDDLMLARHDLALAMGLDGRDLPEWIPADDFPVVDVPALAPAAVVDKALSTRRDLRAADESTAAAAALLAGAEHNTLPGLDLGVSVGYVGALDNDGLGPFFAAAGRNVPGVNAGATLTLELPIGNDAARARRDLRRADHDSALIARADIDRQVRTGVVSALSEVRLAAASLAAVERAVGLLAQSVGDERDKLHEGLSTIIDVVLTEERLTQAELARTAQRLRYAAARARLQFERGALPEVESALAPTAEALLTKEANDGGR